LELNYEQTIYFFYPLLYSIHNILEDPDDEALTPLNLTRKVLASDGIYLLDNGITLFIWVGKESKYSEEIFGCKRTEVEYLVSPEVIL